MAMARLPSLPSRGGGDRGGMLRGVALLALAVCALCFSPPSQGPGEASPPIARAWAAGTGGLLEGASVVCRGAGGRLCPRARLALRGGKKVEFSTDFDDERIQRALLKNAAGKRGRRTRKGLAPLTTPLQIGSLVRAPKVAPKKTREDLEEEERRRVAREKQRKDAIWRQMGITTIGELQMVLWRAAEEGDLEIIASCVAAGADVNFNYTDVPPMRPDKESSVIHDTSKKPEQEPVGNPPTGPAEDDPRRYVIDLRSPPLAVNSRGEPKDSDEGVRSQAARVRELAENEQDQADGQGDDSEDEWVFTSEGSDYNTGVNATAMHIAARNNHSEVIARLAHLGAVVDSTTAFLTTPLMTAAHRGSTEAAVTLVKLGADVFKQDITNMTAAELAERYAADWRIALWLRQVMAWSQSDERTRGEPIPLPFKPGEYPHPNNPGKVWTYQRNWMSAPAAARPEELAGDGMPEELRVQQAVDDFDMNQGPLAEDLGFRMQPMDENQQQDVKKKDHSRAALKQRSPRPPPRPPPPPPPPPLPADGVHPSRASFHGPSDP